MESSVSKACESPAASLRTASWTRSRSPCQRAVPYSSRIASTSASGMFGKSRRTIRMTSCRETVGTGCSVIKVGWRLTTKVQATRVLPEWHPNAEWFLQEETELGEEAEAAED